MGQIVFPPETGGIPPEYLALIGVLASSIIGGVVAFLVSIRTSRTQQRSTEARLKLEREAFLAEQAAAEERMMMERDALHRETQALKAQRKLEIAHKYAELSSQSRDVAEEFLQEIAKQTAIGFLYWESGPDKAKIWVRDDANLLVGRDVMSDVVVSDPYVSRQHMFVHSAANEVSLLPINPTNLIKVDDIDIVGAVRLKHQSKITIGQTNLFYFSLHPEAER